MYCSYFCSFHPTIVSTAKKKNKEKREKRKCTERGFFNRRGLSADVADTRTKYSVSYAKWFLLCCGRLTLRKDFKQPTWHFLCFCYTDLSVLNSQPVLYNPFCTVTIDVYINSMFSLYILFKTGTMSKCDIIKGRKTCLMGLRQYVSVNIVYFMWKCIISFVLWLFTMKIHFL